MWLLNLFTLGVFFACNQYSLLPPPPPVLLLLQSTTGAGSGRLIIMTQTQRVFKLTTGAGASETCVITVADQTPGHNDFFSCFQDRGVSRLPLALGLSSLAAVSPPLSCFLSLSQMNVAERQRRDCRVHTFSSPLHQDNSAIPRRKCPVPPGKRGNSPLQFAEGRALYFSLQGLTRFLVPAVRDID